jgi:hypothetical protein
MMKDSLDRYPMMKPYVADEESGSCLKIFNIVRPIPLANCGLDILDSLAPTRGLFRLILRSTEIRNRGDLPADEIVLQCRNLKFRVSVLIAYRRGMRASNLKLLKALRKARVTDARRQGARGDNWQMKERLGGSV